MNDPYAVLGATRGASFEELRAAYRSACKTRHPEMGGSREALIELNAAYSFILGELKTDYQQREQAAPEQWRKAWSKRCREIDEELESVQRAAQDDEDRFRAALREPTASGAVVHSNAQSVELGLGPLFAGLAHGSLRWLAAAFAALLSVGALLVETNLVSAIVILGSGIGFFISLALKSDKGGVMSAGLLLFGIATIWVPAVRAALLGWPLATISVLVCLALIFKFSHDGGRVGLLTGGVLAIFLIGVILNETQQSEPGKQVATTSSPQRPTKASATNPRPTRPVAPATPPRNAALPTPGSRTAIAAPPQPSSPPAPRELFAAQGSVLKFVDGVSYQLKLRSGRHTKLIANSGTLALYRGSERTGDCRSHFEFIAPIAGTPYANFDQLIRSCNGDAIFQVTEVW